MKLQQWLSGLFVSGENEGAGVSLKGTIVLAEKFPSKLFFDIKLGFRLICLSAKQQKNVQY